MNPSCKHHTSLLSPLKALRLEFLILNSVVSFNSTGKLRPSQSEFHMINPVGMPWKETEQMRHVSLFFQLKHINNFGNKGETN